MTDLQSRVGAVDDRVDGLGEQVGERPVEVDDLERRVARLTSLVDGLTRELEDLTTQTTRDRAFTDNAISAIQDRWLDEHDTEFVVDEAAGCERIQQVFDDLRLVRLGRHARITVRIQPGTYRCEAALVVHHPQGDQIAVTGRPEDPSLVKLQFPDDGLRIDSGGRLGQLTGLSISGSAASVGVGIRVESGAAAHIGPGVVVQSFRQGIAALSGGSIDAHGVTVDGVGQVGLYVLEGSRLKASDVLVLGGPDWGALIQRGSVSNLASVEVRGARTQAFRVEQGSTLVGSSLTATSVAGQAMSVTRGSNAELADFVVQAGTGAGTALVVMNSSAVFGRRVRFEGMPRAVTASTNSSVDLDDCTISDASQHGVQVERGAAASHNCSMINVARTNIPSMADDQWAGAHITAR